MGRGIPAQTSAPNDLPAPGDDIVQREPECREDLVDHQIVGVVQVLAHRDLQRIALVANVCQRFEARTFVDGESELIEGRQHRNDTERQRLLERTGAAVGAVALPCSPSTPVRGRNCIVAPSRALRDANRRRQRWPDKLP